MATQASPDPEALEELGMRARIERFDWAATALGARERWPAPLRSLTQLVLDSAAPMAIYWGPDLHLIYNDAWSPFLGQRHPDALGQPARRVWPELWDLVGEQFAEVLRTGRSLSFKRQLLKMTRRGHEEETYFNYDFTPVRDDHGRVAGVLNIADEVTAGVLAEQRLSFQVAVADRLRGLTEPTEVKAAATEMLGRYLKADRVGYAEVDEGADLVLIRRDWVRHPDVGSLQGRTAKLSELPSEAIEYLRTGEVLALPDVLDFASGSSAADANLGEKLAVRAVITVPLIRHAQIRAMLFVHGRQPRAWTRAEAAMARDVAERSWAALERSQAERSLRASEEHYRQTVELNPQVTWTSLPDGQLNQVSQRWHDWTGTSGLGDSWASGLHPDDREPTFEAWGRSVGTGEPYDIEHRVKMLSGEFRWARSRAFPRRDASGAITLWYGTTEDIHERKLGEERQRLLVNELNHRVKNTLATVQAIAFQTLKGDMPLAEARARFEARLLALSRAHNLLTDCNWEGATLAKVVADSLAHLADPQRIRAEGSRVWLAPRAALALALALHELSTNAAKYGALSGERGGVLIRWEEQGDLLRLIWKESDGPSVPEPSARGFGSRLIERGLAADLGGTARLLFEPDGVRCIIEASLDAARQAEPSHD
ncbi:MAG TPA: HWE histidine kinase domain-containing protein [Allosphingosinicella sp.]|jgi:PAS domain S-box-containing protein|uniref:PAS domain-containing sensor histidine kinase n=1 Tax=Allosphingosinicella sp. TaxID=2823234 RepID=UPI002F290AD6